MTSARRTPPARKREPTKEELARLLAMREIQAQRQQERWLKAIGPNGGLMSWSSSPLVMWLGRRLGRAAQ